MEEGLSPLPPWCDAQAPVEVVTRWHRRPVTLTLTPTGEALLRSYLASGTRSAVDVFVAALMGQPDAEAA